METAEGVPERLVAATVRLLHEEGPSAVQARRLAKEIGASTMAVYHYFGGMPGLLRAVSAKGFERLGANLATVAVTDDPVADICLLALAYRETAQQNPNLYDLMFGLSAPGGHRPEGETLGPDESDVAYGHLVNAVGRAMAADRIRPGDPLHVAAQLWSLLHGYVTLELAGQFSRLDDGVSQVLLPMGANLLIGLGDSVERVEASAARAFGKHA